MEGSDVPVSEAGGTEKRRDLCYNADLKKLAFIIIRCNGDVCRR